MLPFWVADMDLAAPPAVVAALEARAAHGMYGYTNVPASLVAAIRGHLARAYGWHVEAEWLVFLPGVVPALNLACRAYAAQGEAVVTITPAYPPFLEAPPAGRRLSRCLRQRSDERWRLPLEALEAAFTPQTRLLLFCHPHNPLGRVWDEGRSPRWSTCAVAAASCSSPTRSTAICSRPSRHVPAARRPAPRLTVTLMSPSKTFNLPGLNFAFAVIPDEELRRRFRRPRRGCCRSPAASPGGRRGRLPRGGRLAGRVARLSARQCRPRRGVRRAGVEGVGTTRVEATYLAWLDARARLAARGGDDDLARVCLRTGVALSGGGAFGAAPGCARLNFGCPRPLLEEGLARLKAALVS